MSSILSKVTEVLTGNHHHDDVSHTEVQQPIEKEHVVTEHTHETVPVVQREVEQTVVHPVIERQEDHQVVDEHVSETQETVHHEVREDVQPGTVQALNEKINVNTETTFEEHEGASTELAPEVHENVIEHHVDVVQPVIERTIEKNIVHHVEKPIVEHVIAEPIIAEPLERTVD